MKKIVRNVFALILALTFILSLAACGGNSASSGAAPAASGSEETSTVASTPETKDPVTLTVYTWWDITKFGYQAGVRYHSQQVCRYHDYQAGSR